MMDLTLYKLLIQQLPEPPNLAIIKDRRPIPENWPVVLESIHTFRKQILHFTVTDGTTSVICVSTLPELYERVASMELGTIIHLIGAETVFDDNHRGYILDLHDVCTLKEYDDHLKAQQEEEARRIAWQREQGYWEEYHEGGEASWEAYPPKH